MIKTERVDSIAIVPFLKAATYFISFIRIFVMNSIRKKSFLLALFLFPSLLLIGQTGSNDAGQRYSVSIVSSIGSQQLLNVDYQYQNRLLKIQLSGRPGRRSTRSEKAFQFQYLLQLQAGYSIYRYDEQSPVEKGIEAGINGGFIFSWQDRQRRFRPYMAIHAGPHYISGRIKRQKPGFIFSDNFALGLLLRIKKDIYLDMRPAFRHLSNAGLGLPNGGINTLQWGLGIHYDF